MLSHNITSYYNKNKTIITNVIIMLILYLLPIFFEFDKGRSNVEVSYPKAFFLLAILVFWFVGLLAPSPKEINKKNAGTYYILSILGFMGNMFIIGGMLAYFGMSNQDSEPYAILPPVILGFTESYLLLLPLDKWRAKKKRKEVLYFNNIYLTLYSALGFSYVWYIVLYFANYETTNILLIIGMFIFIGLPFRRYFIIDELEKNKSFVDKFFLFLSYVLMFIISIHQYL